MWWIADEFIEVLYGPRWLPAAEPLKILIVAGVFRTINNPCGVLLAAQNRLSQELVGQIAGVVFTIIACLLGLNWGLRGVAWALVASSVFYATFNYVLVYRTIHTRVTDLFWAAVPATLLNAPLVVALAVTHSLTNDFRPSMPALYLFVMVFSGVVVYAAGFLFLPIPALSTEARRWRQKIRGGLNLILRR